MMKQPAPGDPAPDFTLSTPLDVELSLHPTLLKGPVLLEFIRGTWDPATRERIEELAASSDRFRDLKGTPLLISCEEAEGAGKFLEEGGCPFSLLIDVHFEASQAFGVFQKFSWGAINVARPASFIIDRCGYVRLSHVGSSPIDGAAVDGLLEKFAALKEEEGRDQA